MGKKWTAVLAAVLLLCGAGILLYPAVSQYVNAQNGSYAAEQLRQQADPTDPALAAQLALARAYNGALPVEGENYGDILNFGDGLMGSLSIPKIGVELPIYHGTGGDALAKGVGHMPQTAFPIGGPGTHAVLTGHTGLPSARLLTDLTELAAGDRFSVTVAGQTLVYEVDQILTVLPEGTAALAAVPGMDYCTLVTCTPYGINSHRLLVRGVRVTEEADP